MKDKEVARTPRMVRLWSYLPDIVSNLAYSSRFIWLLYPDMNLKKTASSGEFKMSVSEKRATEMVTGDHSASIEYARFIEDRKQSDLLDSSNIVH